MGERDWELDASDTLEAGRVLADEGDEGFPSSAARVSVEDLGEERRRLGVDPGGIPRMVFG